MTKNEFKVWGKRLFSLIPNKSLVNIGNSEGQKNVLIEIPINRMSLNSNQLRKNFRNDEILDLSKFIKIHGVLRSIYN